MKPENGRQTQGPGKEVSANKRNQPGCDFTKPTRREIIFRFFCAGQLVRQIDKNMGLNNREGVERTLQNHGASRGDL